MSCAVSCAVSCVVLNRFGGLKLGLLSNDPEVVALGENLRVPVVVHLQSGGDVEETTRQLAAGTPYAPLRSGFEPRVPCVVRVVRCVSCVSCAAESSPLIICALATLQPRSRSIWPSCT